MVAVFWIWVKQLSATDEFDCLKKTEMQRSVCKKSWDAFA